MAGTVVAGQGDATKVMADARQALGGARKLEALKTLAATGRTVRTMPNGNTMEGDFEMALELPDKFVRRDVMAAMGNMSVYRLSGFNGDGLISETDTPPALSTGNVVMHVRMASSGGDPATMTPEQKEAARQAAVQAAKRDFTRLALGMLVTLPSCPLAFTHGGTAESPDGTADIIDVKGEGIAARLFIDSKTHLPLMLSWMDKEPLRGSSGRLAARGAAPAGGGGGNAMMWAAAGLHDGRRAGRPGCEAAGAADARRAREVEKQRTEQVKEAEAKRRTVEFRVLLRRLPGGGRHHAAAPHPVVGGRQADRGDQPREGEGEPEDRPEAVHGVQVVFVEEQSRVAHTGPSSLPAGRSSWRWPADTPVSAQDAPRRARLLVTVLDQTGAVLPNAPVTVSRQDAAAARRPAADGVDGGQRRRRLRRPRTGALRDQGVVSRASRR